jgi:Rrf2 family protein
MKISQTVSYALQATLQLAQYPQGVPVPCSKLANQGKMPERFLLQILRSLVTRGILRSTRGVEGGYTLARDPGSVSLLEVIEAIDGELVASVELGMGLPAETQSRLRAELDRSAQVTRQELHGIKLSHLIQGTLAAELEQAPRKNRVAEMTRNAMIGSD